MDAKLPLKPRFDPSNGAKLALKRRFGRPDGAKLVLERRLGALMAPSWLWNGVLGALNDFKSLEFFGDPKP